MNDATTNRMTMTAAALTIATLSATAAAGTESVQASYTLALSPAYRVIEVPRFDDQDGDRVLLGVLVHVDGLVGAAATIENDGVFAMLPGARIEVWGDTVVMAPGLAPAVLAHEAAADLPAGTALASSDGVPGAGPDFHDYGFVSQSRTVDRASSDAATLAAYTGSGTVPFEVEAAGLVFQDYDTGAEHTFVVSELVAEGTVTVTYEFDVVDDGCVGDLDGSGAIAFSDLMAVLGAWGACTGPCPADLTGNGSVGFADLDLLLRHWGVCP